MSKGSLKGGGDTDIISTSSAFCSHCGKMKQADKEADYLICPCCDKLRSCLLTPTVTTESNLDNLLSELCGQLVASNTPEGKTFVDIKEQFLEDNYPNLQQGSYTHPDIFISKMKKHGFPKQGEEASDHKGNVSDRMM